MSYYDDTAFTLLCVIVGKKTTSVCDLSDSEPKSIKVDTASDIESDDKRVLKQEQRM